MRPHRVPVVWHCVLSAMAGVALLSLAQSAHAASCGDTIGPGGTVVLDADLRCTSDGAKLRVIGPVSLDLNGHTIDCGGPVRGANGPGNIGILIEGTRADVRNGTLINCNRGIWLSQSGAGRHTAANLTLRENDTGILVDSHYTSIVRNTAHQNIDGIRITGTSNSLMHNSAINNRVGFSLGSSFNSYLGASHSRLLFNLASHNSTVGFFISTCEDSDEGCNDNTFISNEATNNGGMATTGVASGFRAFGMRTTFLGNRATDNVGSGFLIEGAYHVLSGNVSKRNTDGVSLIGVGHVVEHNVVQKNRHDGIVARSGGNTIVSNTVRKHHTWGSDLAKKLRSPSGKVDPDYDCQDDVWSNNVFRTRTHTCME